MSSSRSGFRCRIATIGAVVSGLFMPSTASAAFSLLSQTWGDVITVTDVTPAGRELTPASREHPVYYRGLSLGCKLGSIPGDDEPDEKTLLAFVARVLAKQGYRSAASRATEPSLFLVVQWGYLRPGSGDLLWFLGYDASQDIGAPTFPGQLGPEVWRRNFRSRTIETVLENASDPNYGIIITAFDYKSARSPQPVIYWQTRISLPAHGKSMQQALPTMLLAAGPTIGRETHAPVLRDADDAVKVRVDYGELRVLDDDDPSDIAPSTAPSEKSGPSSPPPRHDAH